MNGQVDPRLKRIQDRIADMNSSMASTGMTIRIITLITPKNQKPACTVEFVGAEDEVISTATYTFEDIMSEDFLDYSRAVVKGYLKSR